MKKIDKMKEYVLKTAHEKNIKFIRLWFTDVQGFLKSFAITVEELEGALSEGMGFDGSSIEGYSRIEESDVIAMPDPSTFQILPWRPEEKKVARMICDVLTPDRKPYEGDPRYVLKRALHSCQVSQIPCMHFLYPQRFLFHSLRRQTNEQSARRLRPDYHPYK